MNVFDTTQSHEGRPPPVPGPGRPQTPALNLLETKN